MKVDKSNRLTGLGPRVLIAVCAFAMIACTPIYRNHGYVPSDQELAGVEIGDTQEDVANKIGRPSAQNLLDESGWYYVQSRWKTVGGRAPQEIDRQVVAVTFDQGGNVANVERFGLERGRVVALSRRVTESSIKGLGFIRQLFANVGRVTAGQFLNQNGPSQ